MATSASSTSGISSRRSGSSLVDVSVGEFVLVHVGFAIQRLSREEGLETREIFKQVYAAMAEE